jgi:hypothetical protein
MVWFVRFSVVPPVVRTQAAAAMGLANGGADQ